MRSRRTMARLVGPLLVGGGLVVSGTLSLGGHWAVADGDQTAPSKPTGLHAITVGPTSVRLGWTASTDNVGVVGYDVFKWSTRLTGTKGATTVTLTGLTPARAYTFKVSARDAAGNSSALASLDVTTTAQTGSDTTPPTAPGNLHVVASTSTTVRFGWTESTDAGGVIGYDVFRDGVRVTGTSSSTTVTATAPTTPGSWTVKARDAAGNVSSASNAVTWPAVVLGNGSPTDANIRYFGRWDRSDASWPAARWAGAYVKTSFTGTTVKLRQRNAIDLWASIDGGSDVAYSGVSGVVNLTPTALSSGTHTLRVSYRAIAGSYKGDAVFGGLILDSGAGTKPPAVSAHLIEFVGDSITVGTLTSQLSLTAYPWLTAERLHAEHTQIAEGGACLVATSDGCVGLSAQFAKTSSSASSADWNFSTYQADAVVINLGTNDVGHSVHTPEFQSTYTDLLAQVRKAYPKAEIFAMRNFKGRYADQTLAAVQARNSAGDSKVHYVDTTGWIDQSTDTVDGTHPTDAGHRKVADQLVSILSPYVGS